ADPRRGPAQGSDPQRPLALADARSGCGGYGWARRAGAALPQPARLCALNALPGLRPSLRMSELLLLAGRAPIPAFAGLPPLRPCGAHPARLCRMRQCRFAGALRSGRRAHCRRGRGPISRQALHRAVQRLSRRNGAAADRVGRDCRGRVRHRHRHPTRGKGAQFPAHDPSGRARRRYRPHLGRSASPTIR
ncbi:MAG: hypothetical protein K0Q80_3072, partial [Microvirga sp.]|nr:hypothetical protein [Microvirga sp.]